VPGAVLHDRVAGFEDDLRPVVELEHHLTGEHHLEVDRRGRVHPGVAGFHVGEHAGEVGLHLGEGGGHVEAVGRGGAGGRQGEGAEAEAADRREVGGARRLRTVVGEAGRLVAAPELVERRGRVQHGVVAVDQLVGGEDRLAVAVVPRHHSPDLHRRILAAT
jgi:hypothetical protein